MERWFGLQFNFKWPHDGFNLGIGFEFFDEDANCPWNSLVIRCLVVTMVLNIGYGSDTADIYNNQGNDN
tara:strand:- start:543 stop:749 length:207 start_codon:yes stop_codon:yes gene_type:complete